MKTLLFALLLYPVCLFGSDWYVRPLPAGSSDGTDWSNAWTLAGIKWGSVKAGDKIWLAGGTHSSVLNIGASGVPGNPIMIERVQAGDAVPAAASGWSSSFDSQVVINPNGAWPVLAITSQHDIRIDGRVPSGILLVGPQAGGDNSRATGAVSNIYITKLELIGSAATSGLSFGRYGFNWAFGTVTNSTFDHCKIHQICNAFRAGAWNGVTVQHCKIYDMTLDNIDHNDVCYTATSSAWPMNNVIWRYNTIYNSPSDGLLFESDSVVKNWYFYGNVYYNCVYAQIQTKAPGNYQMFVYNNVFAGQDPVTNFAFINFQGTFTGSFVQNNIFLNCENQTPNGYGVISDYNAYFPAIVSGVSRPNREFHSVTLNANPFVSSTNFRLTDAGARALAHGIALHADGFLNKDMDGNARGWHIGAYASGLSPMPAPHATEGSAAPTNREKATKPRRVPQ